MIDYSVPNQNDSESLLNKEGLIRSLETLGGLDLRYVNYDVILTSNRKLGIAVNHHGYVNSMYTTQVGYDNGSVGSYTSTSAYVDLEGVELVGGATITYIYKELNPVQLAKLIYEL